MQWSKKGFSWASGKDAETIAYQFLADRGLILMAQNFRCRSGEIDLIMADGAEIVFIEVKFRANDNHGRAEEFFHASKRKKFESALKHFLHQQRLNPAYTAHRIDVVAINGKAIEWFKYV